MIEFVLDWYLPMTVASFLYHGILEARVAVVLKRRGFTTIYNKHELFKILKTALILLVPGVNYVKILYIARHLNKVVDDIILERKLNGSLICNLKPNSTINEGDYRDNKDIKDETAVKPDIGKPELNAVDCLPFNCLAKTPNTLNEQLKFYRKLDTSKFNEPCDPTERVLSNSTTVQGREKRKILMPLRWEYKRK